jgi:hypothetical protein
MRSSSGHRPLRDDAPAQTTRDHDRQDRINAERRQRTELIAEQQRQHQAWLAATYEPPPF